MNTQKQINQFIYRNALQEVRRTKKSRSGGAALLLHQHYAMSSIASVILIKS